jgi:hypothetical protein
MEKLERRLATLSEFRTAIKTIVGERMGATKYTDKPQYCDKNTNKRYTSLDVDMVTDKDIENIEFALWMLGATACTRATVTGLRGTCVKE